MGLDNVAVVVQASIARLVIGLIVLLTGCSVAMVAQGNPATPQHRDTDDPALTHRLSPKATSSIIAEGKIKLDVVVDDGAGKPVLELQPWDFKVFDNNRVRKVLSFRAYDGVTVMPDPPVEVILVMDTLNLPFQQVAFVRGEVDQFLRQNGGKLKQPLTLVLLTDAGIRFQPRPSTDGNAIASVVDGIKGSVSVINSAMGGDGYVERFQRSAKAMDNIAQNEARKPGRKLLIWVGPGWPILNRPSDGYSDREQRRNFDNIVELSTALRQARITAYSVAPSSAATPNTLLYKSFLNPVKTYRDADFGNMALKVLVTQTGGKILGPDNDLAGQISRCIEDANAFYRISFDPPAAVHADEYHDLRVTVDKPETMVRTSSGYYNQPAEH
ncbi:VWA domain-containing protein [Telmatobacter sp. DSM 110680]|uniref:VWA domain-containing protein n=1 Tax=Telmatobacter sp. DSM 110680 TaxID=3036704 RepID=A0AAU7DPI8_9BACT